MRLIATTLHGLEEVLSIELKEIGATDVEVLNRAVAFKGDKELMYKCNLQLRTALRILKPIKTFVARDEDELYQNIFGIDWMKIITLTQTFAIDTSVSSDVFRHSKYVALKSKDAIADQFNKKTGRRPFVGTTDPDIRIRISCIGKQFTVMLDSSGDPLHKRGYRTAVHEAPMNEVLAAGLIAITGWNKSIPLIDPMCGSGTIAIEAAMKAANVPAGVIRKKYCFMNWDDFDKELWDKVYNEAMSAIDKSDIDIKGFDISARCISMCKASCEDLGIDGLIEFKRKAFEKNTGTENKGIIIMNPPYGERLEKSDIFGFYSAIGTNLKRNFEGYTAWIISSNDDALESLCMRSFKTYKLFNGALDCKFQKFPILETSISI